MQDFIQSITYILKDAIEIGFIWSIMSLGVFLSFRVLQFADLTTEGSLTLGGAISASLLMMEINPIVAIVVSLVGGLLAGAVTGFMHTKWKIPGILAGIISMTGLYSINLRIMGRASLYLGNQESLYTWFRNVFEDPFIAKSITSLIVLSIVFIALYWFFGTEIGMSIRATGMNQKMAISQGIPTHRMIILGLALANGLIAISGALTVQSTRSANMDIGKGTIVIGLASIIIGEVLFGKRSFKNWLLSVVLGSIVFQGLIGIAIALGLPANDMKLLQAILIAIILSLPIWKPSLLKWTVKKKEEQHART